MKQFPLLPLRDIVIYPGMVVPLFIGRSTSTAALEAAMSSGRFIFLAAQRNSRTEDPLPEDIYSAGILCQVIQLLRLPNGNVKVLVEGKSRGEIHEFEYNGEYYTVRVSMYTEPADDPSAEITALMAEACTQFTTYHAETKNSLSQDARGKYCENYQSGSPG